MFSRPQWRVKNFWGSLYRDSSWASVKNFFFILGMKTFMRFHNILYLHRQIPCLLFSLSVNIYAQETLWETSKIWLQRCRVAESVKIGNIIYTVLFLKNSLYNNNIFSNAVSKFIEAMLNMLIFSGFDGLNLQ